MRFRTSGHGTGEERKPFRNAPDGVTNSPAGLENSVGFRDGALHVREKHDSERAGNQVERGLGKIELFGIHDAGLHVRQIARRGVLACLFQHSRVRYR